MKKLLYVIALGAWISSVLSAAPLGTAFTYQGRLSDGSTPATGLYDLRFTLYDAVGSVGAVGGALTNAATSVTNGLFTSRLDFGSNIFTGDARWLELAIRTNGSAAPFEVMTPRNELTPAPHALYAASANAVAASNLTGTVSLAQLPPSVVSNNAANITLTGAFSGNGAGLTNLPFSALPANVLTNNQAGVSLRGLTVLTNLTVTGTNFVSYLLVTNPPRIDGGSITNLNAAALAGTLPLATLPAVVVTNNAANVSLTGAFGGNGAGVTNVNAAALNGLNATNYWQLGGNTVAAGQWLGSANYQPVELKVNGTRALRLEPTTDNGTHGGIVNLVGGSPTNFILPGTYGSVIAGGGATYWSGAPQPNRVSADFSFLGGGHMNSIQSNSDHSFLGGGDNNVIQMNANHSFIGGGDNNSIEPDAGHSFLGGGEANTIQSNASYSFLGGGAANAIQLSAFSSFLGAGEENYIQTNAAKSFLGCGSGNTIQTNSAESFLGGGFHNSIQPNSMHVFLGGGSDNSIQTYCGCAFLGGGQYNFIQYNSWYAFLGAGNQNSILTNCYYAFLGGGYTNTIQANAAASFLGSGMYNTIQPGAYSSFLGAGNYNTNGATFSVVPGGDYNYAGGQRSFAAGHRAKANYDSDFVWADGQNADFNATAANQFLLRAQGGVGINTNNPQSALHVNGTVTATAISSASALLASSGGFANPQLQLTQTAIDYARLRLANPSNTWDIASGPDGSLRFYQGGDRLVLNTGGLTINGTFVSSSDRNTKENFQPVDAREVLARVVALPLSRWNYKEDAASQHLGPMAQDFHAAFGVGPDDKHIATVDADGVALAAIQGLNQKLEAKNAALEQRLSAKDVEFQALQRRLEAMEKLLVPAAAK